MQLGFAIPVGEQGSLENHVVVREVAVPTVRPMADAELEATFTRAAMAWARWRERQRWAGR